VDGNSSNLFGSVPSVISTDRVRTALSGLPVAMPTMNQVLSEYKEA